MVEKIEIPNEDYHIQITKADENGIVMVFYKNNSFCPPFSQEQIEDIKKEIKDWGKWKIFKKLKKDLEN